MEATVNLAPWRQQQCRQKRAMLLKTMLQGLVLVFVCLGVVSMFQHYKRNVNQQRLNRLYHQMARLEPVVAQTQQLFNEKKVLMVHLQLIQSVEATQRQVICLLSHVANSMPEGVFLTDVVVLPQSISLGGQALSLGKINEYVRQLAGPCHVGSVVLNNVIQNKEEKKYKQQFDVTMQWGDSSEE